MENKNVIRNILFLQNDAWDRIESLEATLKSKEDIMASIKQMCVLDLITDCEIIEEKKVVIYSIQQKEGITVIRVQPTDEYNAQLANLLKRKQKNFAKETTIIIKNGNCYIDSNYTVEKRKGEDVKKTIEKLRILKKGKLKNGSKKRKIEGSRFCYTFYTKKEEKINVYVASTETKIVEQLDEIAEIKKQQQQHKKILCGLGLGLVLTVSSPYIGKAVRFLYEEHTKQSQIQYLFESNMPRIKSLYRNLQDYGYLPEEQMNEFRDRVDCLITCIEEGNLKDESYPLLLEYRQEIYEKENSIRGYKR